MLLSERIRRATYFDWESDSESSPPKYTAATITNDILRRIAGIPCEDKTLDDSMKNHPFAAAVFFGISFGHGVLGSMAGLLSSTWALVVSATKLAVMGSGSAAIIVGGLMAAGAIANAAAPLVRGMGGRKEENPQRLWKVISRGAWDGLCTPVMAAGLIGSLIGRLVGGAAGLAGGAVAGAMVEGAICMYKTMLLPLYRGMKAFHSAFKPSQPKKATVEPHKAGFYDLMASRAGQRLRTCFTGLAGKADRTPSVPNNVVVPFPGKPRQTDTGGPQNG